MFYKIWKIQESLNHQGKKDKNRTTPMAVTAHILIYFLPISFSHNF